MAAHVSSTRAYVTVCLLLLLATFVTVRVAEIDLGVYNVVVALIIAGFKASLVVLFFMHVREADQLTKTVALAGLLWFGILIALTLADYLTRSVGTFG